MRLKGIWGSCQIAGTEPRRLLRLLASKTGTILIVGLMLFAYNAWASPGSVPEAEPSEGATASLLSYQGYLTDAIGNPLNCDVDITFRLYDTPTGSSALWSEAHENGNAVPVVNGQFNILLGSLAPIPSDVWSSDTVYLGVQVGSDTEMTPRDVVSAVPYALRVPDGAITQREAPFAPIVWNHGQFGGLGAVEEPVIYSGWFHGGASGDQTHDLSSIFTVIDAVVVTRTRSTGGNDDQVTFRVTDAAGTGVPIPSEVRIWARDPDGNPRAWIQGYFLVIGR